MSLRPGFLGVAMIFVLFSAPYNVFASGDDAHAPFFSDAPQPRHDWLSYSNWASDNDDPNFNQQSLEELRKQVRKALYSTSYRIFFDLADMALSPQFSNIGFAYRYSYHDMNIAYRQSNFSEKKIDVQRKEVILGYNSFLPYRDVTRNGQGMILGFDFSYAELTSENDYDKFNSKLYSYGIKFGYRFRLYSWMFVNASLGARIQSTPFVKLKDSDGNETTHVIDSLGIIIPDGALNLSFEF